MQVHILNKEYLETPTTGSEMKAIFLSCLSLINPSRVSTLTSPFSLSFHELWCVKCTSPNLFTLG